jgi:DNA-binding NarL/FixJ family response regulator
MYRILLVDDHAVVRKGLRSILEEGFSGVSVGEASTGREAIEMLREHAHDAVVLDIGLPDTNGLELLKRIKAYWPKVPVLVLSVYGEDQYGERMLKAGAAGYLSKSSAPERMVEAMKRILSGGRYISSALAERIALRSTQELTEDPHQALSNREYEVFRLIVSGMTVSQIARALSLSVKTISTHRSRILAKMNMKSNAELTHYAAAKALLDLSPGVPVEPASRPVHGPAPRVPEEA